MRDPVILLNQQIGELRSALVEAVQIYMRNTEADRAARGVSDDDVRMKELLDLSGVGHFAEFETPPWWASS